MLYIFFIKNDIIFSQWEQRGVFPSILWINLKKKYVKIICYNIIHNIFLFVSLKKTQKEHLLEKPGITTKKGREDPLSSLGRVNICFTNNIQ